MNESSLLQLLRETIAAKLGVPVESVSPRERFRRLGVDSLTATGMLAELGRRLGRTLSPTLAWQYPTPLELAAFLAGSPVAGSGSEGVPVPEVLARADDEPVAIVGLACRFPGASDPEAFWEMLRRGVDAVREVPGDRWDLTALYDPDRTVPGKVATRWGGFLDDVAGFDAQFFGISPREAVEMDPQQRLMLELSWEALEDAGVPPTSLKDTRTGVFYGAMWGDYGTLPEARLDRVAQHTATGRDLSIIPARVSYTLGLLGPSLAVNTACSSSLVAVHLARQSLLRGESRLALAGAVNLMLSLESTVIMSKFGAMAPDGRCKAFDARANGYVRGEGGGVVLLKRLRDALADGDRIYCVVRGSAINNDGFSNGLTAPSPRAQEAVVRDACADAGVAPGDVQYVEAHGTGTMLGDPIEAGALGATLGAGRPEDRRLRIGSVKTNLGHLEAAAGMAGLIKVALSMEHGQLPATLNFEKPNPHIPFEELGLRVNSSLSPWGAVAGRRIAGVSSFGFGGTNSHVVLESREEPEIVLLFGGQGSTWPGMGKALLQSSPNAREVLERCDRAMRPFVAWSLVERLMEAPAEPFEQTEFVQPALFAMQVALAAELRARGFRFAAVVGQSMGEVAAAHVAGALSLEDAAKLICVRCQVAMAGARGGRMSVVSLPFDETAQAIAPYGDRVSIAVAAGPRSTVVAGDETLVTLQADLEARGVIVRPIRVELASHSRYMDPVLPELARRLEGIEPREGTVPFWSTVTGGRLDGRALGVGYWLKNLRQPVLFEPTVRALCAGGGRLFVEVDPHPILAQFVEQTLAAGGPTSNAAVVPAGLRDEAEPASLASAEAAMRRAGCRTEGPVAPSRSAELVVLSAKSEGSLRAGAGRLRDWADRRPETTLVDIAFSAMTTRAPLDLRVAIAAADRGELRDSLDAIARGDAPIAGAAVDAVRPKVVFVFPGQGSQWVGMGRQLFAEEAAFRSALEACDRAILLETGWSVIDELQAPPERSRLDCIDVVQAVLFAVEVALAACWRSWGIEPDAVVGHSMGEVAAACTAGILSIADGAAIICRRGSLLTRLVGKGQMALVELSIEDATVALAGYEDRVGVAASNGPASTVLSGDPEALGRILAALEARGVFCRLIKADVAGHSPQLDPLCDELETGVARVAPAPAAIPLISTAREGWLKGPELGPRYWVDNFRQPVRFARAVQTLVDEGFTIFVEISPHPVLMPSVDAIRASKRAAGRTVASLRRDQPERATMLAALGTLYEAGVALDAKRLFPRGGRRLRLPSHAWSRERYWLEPVEATVPQASATSTVPVRDDLTFVPSWELTPPPIAAPSRARRWLLVSPSDALAGGLHRALTKAGHTVVRVDPGGSADAVGRALRTSFAPLAPTDVIHLAGAAGTPGGAGLASEPADRDVEGQLARGYDCVLEWAKGIVRLGAPEVPRLHVVTRAAQPVVGGDVRPVSATVVGLARVVSMEHPELGCTRIDLPADPSGSDVDHVFGELSSGGNEAEVAWRAGERRVLRFVRPDAGARTPAPAGVPAIRSDASYVVTGGLGGLGLSVAEWLARKGAGYVVLLGRSGVRSDAQRAAVARVEALGATVTVLSVDVSDRDALAGALACIPADRPLRGVFHLATILDDGVLTEQSPARLRSVLAAKGRGALNLHALTESTPLDLFVLYSSAIGLLGSPGQANYAAASTLLDALAHYRRARGLPATSIDWGVFTDVGLAATSTRGGRLEGRGLRGMTAPEGIDGLERVLARGATQMAVCPIDVAKWVELVPGAASSSLLAALSREAPRAPRSTTPPVKAKGDWLRTLAALPEAQRVDAVTEMVRAEAARVLSLGRPSAVPPQRPLRQLGLDSLMGVELRNALARRAGVTLPANVMFEHPTPAALGQLLFEMLQAALPAIPLLDPLPVIAEEGQSSAPAPAPAPAKASAFASAAASGPVPTLTRLLAGAVTADLERAAHAPIAPRADRIESIPRGERWFADAFRVIPAPGGFAQRTIDVSEIMRTLEMANLAGIRATLPHLMIRAAAIALARNPDLHQTVCGYRKMTHGTVDIGLSMAGQTSYAPVVVLPSVETTPLRDLVGVVEERVADARMREARDLRILRRWGWLSPFGFVRRLLIRTMQELFSYRRKIVGTFQVTCVPTVDAAVPLQFYSGSILAFGRPRDAVVAVDGKPEVRQVVTLTLCVDHVSMDGLRAATLLNAIVDVLESGELTAEASGPHEERAVSLPPRMPSGVRMLPPAPASADVQRVRSA
jgi:acyl transferase domain-containing protein/acyl carrier protein/NAD(P)-dependent dehydrogenase (short-subunit alcohol dehydrogenase family)